MSRERLECFVAAIENLILEEERHSGPSSENLILEEERHSDPSSENLILEEKRCFDPPSAHYIPHDLARWFLEAAKGFLNGDVESLDRALGLVRPRGRPVDPNKSKNLGLAEIALMRKLQGKTGAEINNEVFAKRAEPPDERHIRTIVDRYKPLVIQKWREDLRRRWLAGSEAREKRSIQKNERKGKSRTANSG